MWETICILSSPLQHYTFIEGTLLVLTLSCLLIVFNKGVVPNTYILNVAY